MPLLPGRRVYLSHFDLFPASASLRPKTRYTTRTPRPHHATFQHIECRCHREKSGVVWCGCGVWSLDEDWHLWASTETTVARMSIQEALQSQTDRATRRFGRILANCCIAVWVQLVRQVQIKSALGVTQVEFRRDLWQQKTRVPDLSCGVILYLAILVEHRLLTDTETDRQTDTGP